MPTQYWGSRMAILGRVAHWHPALVRGINRELRPDLDLEESPGPLRKRRPDKCRRFLLSAKAKGTAPSLNRSLVLPGWRRVLFPGRLVFRNGTHPLGGRMPGKAGTIQASARLYVRR